MFKCTTLEKSSCLNSEIDLLRFSQEVSLSNTSENFQINDVIDESNINLSTVCEGLNIFINKSGVREAIKNDKRKIISVNKTKKYACKFCGKKC